MAHIGLPGTQAPTNGPRRRGIFVAAVVITLAVTLMPAFIANAQITSVKTVFMIVMSNQNWANIKGNSNAPYINSLLTIAASADSYFSPSGVHVAVPNHLWLEAGTGFGIILDSLQASVIRARTATSRHS